MAGFYIAITILHNLSTVKFKIVNFEAKSINSERTAKIGRCIFAPVTSIKLFCQCDQRR